VRRFSPFFILLIVTAWLTVGRVADTIDIVQNEAGRSPGAPLTPRVDTCKLKTAPCMLVRSAAPVFARLDPRVVQAVRRPAEPALPGVLYVPCVHAGLDVPPPPSLTGKVVIRV